MSLGDCAHRLLARAAVNDPSMLARATRDACRRGVIPPEPPARRWLTLQPRALRRSGWLRIHLVAGTVQPHHSMVLSLCNRSNVRVLFPHLRMPRASTLPTGPSLVSQRRVDPDDGRVEWQALPPNMRELKGWCTLCARQFAQAVVEGNMLPTAPSGWQALWAKQRQIGERIGVLYPEVS